MGYQSTGPELDIPRDFIRWLSLGCVSTLLVLCQYKDQQALAVSPGQYLKQEVLTGDQEVVSNEAAQGWI